MTDSASSKRSLHPKILTHFKTVDPILADVFETVVIDVPIPQDPSLYFEDLCAQIIGQQLSNKVADVIFARFEKLFPTGITPTSLLALPDESLRSCGMSWSKVKFLRAIAEAVLAKKLDFPSFPTLTNEKVIEALTTVKGIGPWTAEMFLMFTLAREDIFSFGDLGLKRAIQTLYKMKNEPTRKQMEKLSKKWQPYRTYAALALWKFKDA